jgi:hypothetical protein
MKLRAWLLVALVAGCARSAAPRDAQIEAIARFDGELGAAKEQRRIVALASPT